MTNQERLEEYLVGNKEKNEPGYLKSDISNGKVIMLSGKWGSGKTHFWKNKIEEDLKKEKIPNNYISLYGKTSIQEIKNEVFLKIFESVDSCEVIEKGKNLAKNTVNLASSFFGAISILGLSLDISKITDKPFENLEKMLDDKKLKKTEEYLNSGAIICFDDFERKSKDIDLNDLFGFITQLTLNFSCKVVIILNDDVFEGEEKKIFSNVKEKSVSKFLKYEPSIKELFETIFISDARYRILDNYKEIILNTIEETEELNARIYIQVLDNLVEWIEKNQEINDVILRYLVFFNINFILYHCHFIVKETDEEKFFFMKELEYISNRNSKILIDVIRSISGKDININSIIDEIITSQFIERNTKLINFVNENKSYIKALCVFYKYKINYIGTNNIFFQKINNFIETGILINE